VVDVAANQLPSGVQRKLIAREALLAAAVASRLPDHESVSMVRSGVTAGRRSTRQPRAAGAALSTAAVAFPRRALRRWSDLGGCPMPGDALRRRRNNDAGRDQLPLDMLWGPIPEAQEPSR